MRPLFISTWVALALLATMYGALAQSLPKKLSQRQIAAIKKLAANGNAGAQFDLGQMYDLGISMQQDYARAVFWYRKAAEQGDADAQTNLCAMYGFGHGAPQDYVSALAWCRKAAEQGQSSAQYSLGASYYQGHGVPQDYAEAYFWFDVAAAGNFKRANIKQEGVYAYRDEAASHLSPNELARAQERARQWFESHQSQSK